METPVRRVTRSQMSSLGPSSGIKPVAAAGAGRLSSTNSSAAKKKELPRPPFTDLTNDSPISGLMPAKMATNAAACVYESTPRSKLRPADSRPIGEDLLRMQVTSLLRKVESEALKENSKNTTGSRSSVPEMFESPMRLAAPTPANTPAALGTCVPGATTVVEVKESSTLTTTSLQVIVVSSPVIGALEVPVELEAKSAPPNSVHPLNVPKSEVVANGAPDSEQQQEQEKPTTRTLQFDSPEKSTLSSISVVENASIIANSSTATPGSVTTTEILASIEEGPVAPVESAEPDLNQPTRTLEFDSPAKQNAYFEGHFTSSNLAHLNSPPSGLSLPREQMDIESGLFFSSNADHHARVNNAETDADDEDAWSVIVNVHSPEKTEGTDRFLECDVASPSEMDDASTFSFLENVLVDPADHRIEMPALWERRDTPARKGKGKGEPKVRDEDDYCDCEDNYDAAEEETYEDGSDNFDEACEQLCIGISHINMGESTTLPPFQGKHIRFNYNSDDEMEEEVVLDKTVDSPGKVRLNGLPTPKGKHIRFNDGEESSAEDETGGI